MAAQIGVYDALSRALHRRHARHVLLTGDRGVGKTTLIGDLSERIALGEFPPVSPRRVLWLDGRDVSPEQSRARLAALLAETTGQDALLLCLDNVAGLLRTATGGTNVDLFRRLLAQPGVQVIAILTSWEFDELLAADADVLDMCSRITLPEPDEETSLALVGENARRLEREFDVEIARTLHRDSRGHPPTAVRGADRSGGAIRLHVIPGPK